MKWIFWRSKWCRICCRFRKIVRKLLVNGIITRHMIKGEVWRRKR